MPVLAVLVGGESLFLWCRSCYAGALLAPSCKVRVSGSELKFRVPGLSFDFRA